MTTQNPSYFRILPVWLVLLAFLCCMMVPSLAHAKKEMTIATEGDPGDGLESSGGSSGLIGGGSQDGESDLPSGLDSKLIYRISISTSEAILGYSFIGVQPIFNFCPYYLGVPSSIWNWKGDTFARP